ncbi:MAG: ABC transporter substrate-binding protein, partial [Pseudolabrys sp.]
MRRRNFIAGLGSVLAARPISARAQQGERMRRIGVLTSLVVEDRETKDRNAAFVQSLQQLGWFDGQNIRIDFRGATNADHVRQYAAELVALAPDVI